MQEQQNKPVIFLRVSTLSHMCICSKRGKIETFSKSKGTIKYSKNSPLAVGTKQHKQYGFYITDFDREIIKNNLETFKINGAFQKVLELPEVTVVVRGDYDDLRVIEYNLKKFISFIELKTTTKKYMWRLEIESAIKQLQIYLWILRDLIPLIRTVKGINYELWKRHYLEIFSQNTGKMLRRITVEYDDNIEEWIKIAVYQMLGLEPMRIANGKYCLICPKQNRIVCDYYKIRFPEKYEKMNEEKFYNG